MNKIKEFFNEKFGTVKTIQIDDAVYFVICNILDNKTQYNTRKIY